MPKKAYGFTVVELLIVVVVIGILATITVVIYRGMQDRAHDTVTLANVETYTKVLELYQLHNMSYPVVQNYSSRHSNVCIGSPPQGSTSNSCGTTTITGCSGSGLPDGETESEMQFSSTLSSLLRSEMASAPYSVLTRPSTSVINVTGTDCRLISSLKAPTYHAYQRIEITLNQSGEYTMGVGLVAHTGDSTHSATPRANAFVINYPSINGECPLKNSYRLASSAIEGLTLSGTPSCALVSGKGVSIVRQ